MTSITAQNVPITVIIQTFTMAALSTEMFMDHRGVRRANKSKTFFLLRRHDVACD